MHRHFSEFRHHDYRIPRSMRECYGYDARLHVSDEDDGSTFWGWMIAVCCTGLLIWLVKGWL